MIEDLAEQRENLAEQRKQKMAWLYLNNPHVHLSLSLANMGQMTREEALEWIVINLAEEAERFKERCIQLLQNQASLQIGRRKR